ncbi:hypothetical protein P9250_08760 [Caballeronia sp. LP006]|jgi:hypothetical protein|uniref:hypothetical protein n=1 Tax=unclassified Caballeronia TaxID=2646786 RepID=UPI001FD50D12|nr:MULTISPECIES: hypothetical protein [unclassified Caballeronia]MDR5774504.1 hypothetical protein [Caballeronia sp. LZ002]MDR5799888.1 hypothetical protein [Caballeronia sp. LZ001]MDR5827963.1 hypothetical protein [Caballeronia sp. LP006]MDR5849940.1 hypothetical protein [Caballeronia sp. LZ003]
MRYKGYDVAPSAHAMPSGLFAANLTIENKVSPHGSSFTFDALDYFFEADHAVAYALRWARMWIDQRNKRFAALRR